MLRYIETLLAAALFGGALLLTSCATAPKTTLSQSHSAGQDRQTEPPRVMLLIQETSLGIMSTEEVEKLAMQSLIDMGAHVVERDMAKIKANKDTALLKMTGDKRGAAAIGLQFGADLVITGDAVCRPSTQRIRNSRLRTYQGNVTLAVIRTDSARTIATVTEVETAVDVEDVSGSSKALQSAGKKALEGLLPKMMSEWQKQGRAPNEAQGIEITVGGVGQMWMVRAIREKLQGDMKGISNATQRDYVSGVVTFSVQGSLASQILAEELVMDPPEGVKFQVLAIHPRQISLRAAAN